MPLTEHKFKIGQIVYFRLRNVMHTRDDRPYQIIERLPAPKGIFVSGLDVRPCAQSVRQRKRAAAVALRDWRRGKGFEPPDTVLPVYRTEAQLP